MLSEDYSFCWRRAEANERIYAVISERITHVGDIAVKGRYADNYVE